MRECNMDAYKYENDNAKIVLECNAEEGEFNLTLYNKDNDIVWNSEACDWCDEIMIEVSQSDSCTIKDIKTGGMFKYNGEYYIKSDIYHAFNIIRSEFINFTSGEISVKPVKAKLFIEE